MSGGSTLLTSASGILSLLDEPDVSLQHHALEQLNDVVDKFWPEIATAIPRMSATTPRTPHHSPNTFAPLAPSTFPSPSLRSPLMAVLCCSETLYEDEKFGSRDLAAVVASKVFYHLEELDDALKYALGAGELFDLSLQNEYVETLVAKCIDEYIAQRQAEDNAQHMQKTRAAAILLPSQEEKETTTSTAPPPSSSTPIDPRLVAVVERMFTRCYDDGQYHQALGIAIESKRLDQVKASIRQSPDTKAMLQYAYDLSQSLVLSHSFRRSLLLTLVELYEEQGIPDYLNVCHCLLFLDDSDKVAHRLNELIARDDDQHATLVAYQIAFDLGENQNQPFLNRVAKALPLPDQPALPATTTAPSATPSTTDPAAPTASSDATASAAESDASSSSAPMDTSSSSSSTPSPAPAASASPPPAATAAAVVDSDPPSDSYNSRLVRLRSILSGRTATERYLHFLYEHNATDLNLLKLIKDKLEPRNSVTHNATVMAHSLLHCGTTVDSFLRDNLDWLGKAQNWAKFTATASIGVIHKGHIHESLKLLEPYLPQGGQSGSPYQEGGALYALGLVHSSHGSEQVDYLTEALRNGGNNEIVQHGACLGLGLCAMASGSEALFELLKGVLMSESAVAGEAAGYAMGLVLLGSGNGSAVEEMIAYAHDTQHEKIIRGLSMGIAMIVYGKEEEADVIIEQLILDKDPILRYGAMYAIGLAYACTGNNAAVQRLLHIAVSDVSDDVRRAAVTCLGFVLANVPEQVPRVVSLLAASYNPHVRYGSALAVGIACAAGATERIRREALNVLEPLLKDRVDFVRQGAFIGLAMLLIQHNERSEPKLALLRKSISDAMNIKSDTMTKLGAILAAGIVDAGGRNVTISLLSSSGHKKMAAIVGLALFPQFWYWYPLIHFLSLAFTPTAVIGLNKNLDLPQGFTFVSRAPAGLYAYPPPVELEKKEVKKEIKHATLSVTAKAKTKARRKEDERSKGEEEKMEVDEGEEESKTQTTATEEKKEPSAAMDTSTEAVEEKKEGDTTATADAPAAAAASSTTADAVAAPAAAEEKKELPFHVLSNPARVTLPQLSTLTWPKAQRYVPVKQQLSGFVLLEDTQPSKEELLVRGKTPKIGVPGVSDDEPEPPAPFEYTGQ